MAEVRLKSRRPNRVGEVFETIFDVLAFVAIPLVIVLMGVFSPLIWLVEVVRESVQDRRIVLLPSLGPTVENMVYISLVSWTALLVGMGTKWVFDL